MSDEVTAIVGSSAYQNWTAYTVDLDFLTPTDAFTLTVANPTPSQVSAVGEGTSITLMIGGDIILKGWVDEKRYQGSRAGDLMTLAGRDAVSPLVDCHAPLTWSWKDIPLSKLASLALSELGVTLAVDAAAEAEEPISWVHAEPGETYWDILEREAKRTSLMLWSTPGCLHIGRPTYSGTLVGQLRRMVTQPFNASNNVKSAEITWKVSNRRSPITVTGQSSGSDSLYGTGASRLSGQALDSGLVELGLWRPCQLHDAGVRSTRAAKDRASWEVSRRRGETWVARYSVSGHRPSADGVWEIDTLVDLADERVGINGPKWISGVRFQKSRAGTETTLTLREIDSILPPV